MQTTLKIIYAIFLAGIFVIGSLLILTVFPIPGLEMDARVVQSGSMEPSIKTGSIIFIKPADEYRLGDIITFHKHGEEIPITHRIVEVNDAGSETSFVTKGDANRTVDMDEVRENDIIGSMRFQIPLIGHAISLARNPMGLFFLIIIPALMIGSDEARKIFDHINKKKKL